jgi:hypothetical protein
MFTLMARDQNGSTVYSAGLWGLNGEPVSWQVARTASRKAAYSASKNVWEGLSRTEAESWVGSVPQVNGAKSLHLAPGMEDYAISSYVDLNAWWIGAAGITIAAGGVTFGLIPVSSGTAAAVSNIAAIADGVTLLESAFDMFGFMDFSGPIDKVYPVVYYDPLHIGKAPWQLHLSSP